MHSVGGAARYAAWQALWEQAALCSVWWPSLPWDVEAFVYGPVLRLVALLTWDVEAFVQACPTCQCVKVVHGLPQGLTAPLPVLEHRGGTISLDIMKLPRSRSGLDFLQVHIDWAGVVGPHSQDLHV